MAAAPLEILTSDVIRSVARQTASLIGRGATPLRQRPQEIDISTDVHNTNALYTAATSTDEPPMPPLKRKDMLQDRNQPPQVEGTAFWQAFEHAQAHQEWCDQLYRPCASSTAKNPAESSVNSPLLQSRALSPGGAYSSTNGSSSSPRSAPSSVGTSPVDQVTFSDSQDGYPSEADHCYDMPTCSARPHASTKAKAAPRKGNAAQRQQSAPAPTKRAAKAAVDSTASAPPRKISTVSADELVNRLYGKAQEYEQKRVARRQEKAEAEASFPHAPRINNGSKSMAGGVESLQNRMGKIYQQREEKLQQARDRKEQMVEQELASTKPTITSKGARVQRGDEARERWEQQKQEKLMARQHERAQEKLKECTFQPNACNESKRIQTRAKENCNIFNYEDFVHNRLHDDAHRRNTERCAMDADNQPAPKAAPVATSRSTTPRRGKVDSWSDIKPESSRLAPPSSAPVSFEAFMRGLQAS